MRVHQLIDDGFDYPLGGIDDEFAKSLKKVLMSSQKFYLGNAGDLDKSIVINTLFAGPASNVKLPYDITWWEYSTHFNKGEHCVVGNLVFPQDDVHGMATFYKKENRWIFSPMISIFSIGDEINNTVFGGKNPMEQTGYNVGSFYIDNKMQEAYANCVGFENATEGNIRLSCRILNKALMLLSCKNIVKSKNYPPLKLNNKRRKNKKQPLFTYYTLHVKNTTTNGSKRIKNDFGNHNRVHFCRGHFKEFTEQNPLFGSITGRYWWQPHVRGQNKEGIVVKDYSIK